MIVAAVALWLALISASVALGVAVSDQIGQAGFPLLGMVAGTVVSMATATGLGYLVARWAPPK
jgi:hypothetical protein